MSRSASMTAAASPASATELRQLAIQTLAASGVAKKVTASGSADFELRLSMEHLYGTHFAANKQTIVVVNSRSSTDAVVDVHTHNYAGYGVRNLVNNPEKLPTAS